MQINITGRHFEVTEPIREHLNKKLEKLDRYFNRIIEARVILSIEKLRHKAEISLLAKKVKFFAKEESGDMYTSIDRLLNKMEARLRKHKSKLKEHNQHALKDLEVETEL